MYMKDKLEFRKKRTNWCFVLDWFCSSSEKHGFKSYCNKHKRVRSQNKLAFNYLLSLKGRKWIKEMRVIGVQSEEDLHKILKTHWINDYEL